MAKLFAVTIIVIAIASAIPILRHTWWMAPDISSHGAPIDEQMSETMAEAGISFLASQILLGIFIWKFSDRPKDAKIGKFPGGAKGLVIAAFLLVGTEVLALGVFGSRAWASVYSPPVSRLLTDSGAGVPDSAWLIFDPSVRKRDACAGSGRTVRFLFPFSGSGWDFRPHSPRSDQ